MKTTNVLPDVYLKESVLTIRVNDKIYAIPDLNWTGEQLEAIKYMIARVTVSKND